MGVSCDQYSHDGTLERTDSCEQYMIVFIWYFREATKASILALTQEETSLTQYSLRMLRISITGHQEKVTK